MRGLTLYLNKYYEMQKSIVLVKRSSNLSSWSDRCLFLDDKYSPHKQYNHRSVLQQEVVLEYDEDDKVANDKLATWVCSKLNADNIVYSRWRSGNKSQHIHIFIDTREAINIPLLKNAFLRHYGTYYLTVDGQYVKEKPVGEHRKVLPDLRLCANNHLIRAEHGLHEKTQVKKSLVYTKGNYPELNTVPTEVWDRYTRQQQFNATRRLTAEQETDELKKKMQMVLNSSAFRQFEDGRERALFILIHYLKPTYIEKKMELIKYLCDWYRYSGGYKLTEQQIRSKVNYHWNKTYRISNMLDELLESIR